MNSKPLSSLLKTLYCLLHEQNQISSKRGDNIMSTRNIPVTLPVDKDGFLRRECPSCKRQFKWLPTEGGTSEQPQSQYYCPYCRKSAAIAGWWTREQRQYMKQLAAAKIIGPELEKSIKAWKRSNQPRSPVQFEGKYKAPSKPLPLHEPDDMRKVEPPCHPNEPLKIRENWNKPTFCLICGKSFSSG